MPRRYTVCDFAASGPRTGAWMVCPPCQARYSGLRPPAPSLRDGSRAPRFSSPRPDAHRHAQRRCHPPHTFIYFRQILSPPRKAVLRRVSPLPACGERARVRGGHTLHLSSRGLSPGSIHPQSPSPKSNPALRRAEHAARWIPGIKPGMTILAYPRSPPPH